MKKFAALLMLAGIFMTGIACNRSFAQRRMQPVTPGLIRQTFPVDGLEREALVYAPNSIPGNGAPLVFIFHGHGGNMRNSARKFAIHQHWPEAVVFYMQGIPTQTLNDPEGSRNGWQNRPGVNGDRDLKFFDAAVAWAKKNYKIDPSRVFVGGHSNGGGFTYLLWQERANQIAAFAPCSAVCAAAPRLTPRPALVIGGEGDPIVKSENQRRTVDALAVTNKCSAPGGAWAMGFHQYKSSIGAELAVYVHNQGHQLPDEAGEKMAQFFVRQSLRK